MSATTDSILAAEAASILVADDDADIRDVICEVLETDGHAVTVYDPANPDPALLRRPYDVAILDMVMPATDGFTLRREIVKYSPAAQFIIITGHPDRCMLVKTMDLGVFVFLPKPFTADHIRYAVMGALRVRILMKRYVEREVTEGTESMGLVGRSALMVEVRRRISELAPLDIPVLITGESGTGKEVVARCLHRYSRRTPGAFSAVNCAGFSPGLIESELFGHAQGAFTGAAKSKQGFFEATNGGTLFLDEIGDLPLELQSKLLRVLDSGEYNRVGETRMLHTDVRVVSATNRDLHAMVAEGKFRADLYYRLRGAMIPLPPLRERKDDIPALVGHFLGEDPFGVAPDAMAALRSAEWPGNVRELRMTVLALKGTSPGRIITLESVQKALGSRTSAGLRSPALPPFREFKKQVLAVAEKHYFESLLQAASHNIALAARVAGIDRKNLYDKLKQFGIPL